jgi:hypothetical protein
VQTLHGVGFVADVSRHRFGTGRGQTLRDSLGAGMRSHVVPMHSMCCCRTCSALAGAGMGGGLT